MKTPSRQKADRLFAGRHLLINALTGEVESTQNHMSGYPTYQASGIGLLEDYFRVARNSPKKMPLAFIRQTSTGLTERRVLARTDSVGQPIWKTEVGYHFGAAGEIMRAPRPWRAG